MYTEFDFAEFSFSYVTIWLLCCILWSSENIHNNPLEIYKGTGNSEELRVSKDKQFNRNYEAIPVGGKKNK